LVTLRTAFQRRLGLVPDLVRARADLGARREFDVETGEARVAVDVDSRSMKACAFALDLVLGAEDMRVVLGEAAHPHQPVHRAQAS
jgi:hypothetical protein